MEPHAEPTTTESETVARFLHDIERAMVLPAKVSAADATKAVTCALTARVTGGEAQDVLESLPVAVRALLSRCERHPSAPAMPFSREDFVRRVAVHLEPLVSAAVLGFTAGKGDVNGIGAGPDDLVDGEALAHRLDAAQWREHAGKLVLRDA